MNAGVHFHASGLELYDQHPVIVAAPSRARAMPAVQAVEAAGMPVVAIPVEEALARLDRQGRASIFWLELDGDGGPQVDRLLDRIDAEVAVGSFGAIIAAPLAMVDSIAARIGQAEIELLVDATPLDRAAGLALAMAGRTGRRAAVAEDFSAEPSAARLRQLSDEVSRIAATLARLSVAPETATEPPPLPGPDVPSVPVEVVQQVIRARRLRARFFDEAMFADPAWDMLLDLMQAEIAQHRVPVSSLCIAAAVPATTALRWIKTMTDAGLFRRRADEHDGRRVFVELTPDASEAMHRYFREVGKAAVV